MKTPQPSREDWGFIMERRCPMMGYSSLSIDEVRHRANELEHERNRADMLHEALEDIARKQIMDAVNAINMRAIAAAALASESKW